MTTYSELLVGKLLPEWAKSEEYLELFGIALGLSADLVAEQRIIAATAGLIASTTGPEDALPLVATERGGLFRYPTETIEAWRDRLINAAEAWERAGGARCLSEQFSNAGYPGVYVALFTDREGPLGQDPPYISQYWIAIPSAVCPPLVATAWDNMTWGHFWWDTGALPPEFVRLCLDITDKFGDPTSVYRGVEIV